MRGLQVGRTLGAVLLAGACALTGGFLAPGPAGAAVNSGPTALVMRATLRVSVPDPNNLGVPLQIGAPMAAPAPATVGAGGDIVVPAAGIVFATDADPNQPPAPVVPGLVDRVELRATTDFTGAIDPGTGLFWLQGQVAATATGPMIPGCTVGPVSLTLATSNPEGIAYSPANGASKVTDAGFVIGAVAPGTPGCEGYEYLINEGLGLPSAPGSMLFAIDAVAAPSITGAAAAPIPEPPAPASGPSAGPSTPSVGGRTSRTTTPRTTARRTPTTSAAPGDAATPGAAPPTTGYTWNGEDGFSLLGGLDGDDDADRPDRPESGGQRISAAEAVQVQDQGDNGALAIGVIAVIVGSAAAGFFLLRSEARKLLRRRRHAAF